MKRIIAFALLISCVFSAVSCSRKEAGIVNAYDVTDASLAEEYIRTDKLVTTSRYFEMSDGTWKSDDHKYKYRLELSGKNPEEQTESTYVVLSNDDDITFEQAYTSLSSNDFFIADDAKVVAMK